MTNHSTFEQNVMHAFRGYDVSPERLDEADALFMKHGGDVKAEADALAFLKLWEVADPKIDMALDVYRRFGHDVPDGSGPSVKAFVRDTAYRHMNDNAKKTPWPHWSTA